MVSEGVQKLNRTVKWGIPLKRSTIHIQTKTSFVHTRSSRRASDSSGASAWRPGCAAGFPVVGHDMLRVKFG